MVPSRGWCFTVTQGISCLNFHLCTYLSTTVWSLGHEAPSYYIAMVTFTIEIKDVSLSIKPPFSSLNVKRIWLNKKNLKIVFSLNRE